MKLQTLALLFCLSVVIGVGLARSRSKKKGKLENSPSVDEDNSIKNKRTRSIAAETDLNGDIKMTKTASQQSTQHNQGNGGQTGNLRGTKRQKKTEKRKKFKTRDKVERESVDSPESDDDDEMETLPSPNKPVVEEPGLVQNAFDHLARLAPSGEASYSYRSDKLPCSDRLNRLQPAIVETAVEIVRNFMTKLFPHIEKNLSDLKFLSFTLVGSMSEGLAASGLSDFDFHMPLDIGKSQLRAVEIPHVPGYNYVSCTQSVLCNKFTDIVKGKPYFSPKRIISQLQSIVQKAISDHKIPNIQGCSKYRPGYKGPTVSVELDCNIHGRDESLRIELVPLIKVSAPTGEEIKFVAKAADMNIENEHPHSWRKVFH